jgi:hypothetical protein
MAEQGSVTNIKNYILILQTSVFVKTICILLQSR